MAKKKSKYYAYQIGGGTYNWLQPELENPTPSVFTNKNNTGATDIYGNKYFVPNNEGTPLPEPEANEVDRDRLGLFDPRRTALHPAFQWLNAGAQLVTGVADMIGNARNNQYENKQYLEEITPKYYENMEGYGLNANPIYTKYGGSTKYQVGGSTQPDYDSHYKMNAQLGYYKDLINQKLKQKNPKAFTDYFVGLRDLRAKNDQAAVDKYIQDTPYNEYLTPDEVKSTLGDVDYEIYQSYLGALKPKLAGQIEGENDYTNLNYGRRFASMPITPTYSVTNTTRGTNYNRTYKYNPKTGIPEYEETGDISLRPAMFEKQQPKQVGKSEAKELLSSLIQKQTGGSVPKTNGLEKDNKMLANVEAERGEAFQDNEGNIMQVANSAPTHEQGGVPLPNVHRVLENTSDLRKDKASKYLKLSPDQIKAITGIDTTKPMSHAKAMVKANEIYEKERNIVIKKMELASKDRNELDKYGEASSKLNLDYFNTIPTSQQLFDRLFNHQEEVKQAVGIPNPNKAKVGGKFQLGGYTGNKSGLKTPAGNSDAFPATKDYKFEDYLGSISKQGFKYEGITNPEEFQLALYDYALKHNPEDIKKMWSEGMHQKGMTQAKQLGLIDNKGNFKSGVLDDPKNLQKLRDIYADGILGVRTLALNKKPPRIWSDDDTPLELPNVPQELDPTITSNLRRVPQRENKFFEPLRWFDTASPVNAYLSALERIPAKYNPVEFNQLRLKQLDPTAALQQNQADFNAGVQATENSTSGGVAAANIANLAAQKYAANNQVLGNYENQNAQIKNQEIIYNTQVRDKQSLADAQSREVFENKVLEGKAKQQEQKLTALDSLYKTIAENRALNRNGNLIMKFSRAFDQYGEYNGYQPIFGINPTLGIPNTSAYAIPTTTKGKTEPAGGIQGLEPGKNYYNRKTGKTLYFNGANLIER